MAPITSNNSFSYQSRHHLVYKCVHALTINDLVIIPSEYKCNINVIICPMTSDSCVPSFSIIWICRFKSHNIRTIYLCTIKFLLIHQSILQLMIKRCIQRLQRSIPIKRFKVFNTRKCSINNVIQLIQCHVRSRCHLNMKGVFISGSVHILSNCYYQLFPGFYTVHRGTPFEQR